MVLCIFVCVFFSSLFLCVFLLFNFLCLFFLFPPLFFSFFILFFSYFLFFREKSDPFAVENLDSNNVLEMEITAVEGKAATGDLSAVMRKGALDTKLLVSLILVQGTRSCSVLGRARRG